MVTLAGNGAKRGTTLPQICGFESRQESKEQFVLLIQSRTKSAYHYEISSGIASQEKKEVARWDK